MKASPHWTAGSSKAFIHAIAFDFIAQLQERMEKLPLSQAELAQKLGVTEGAVSKVLNKPENLTMKTMVNYARATGMKVAIVAYDDGDEQNERGPINSEIFSICWKDAGKPRDFWSLRDNANYFTVANTPIASAEFQHMYHMISTGYVTGPLVGVTFHYTGIGATLGNGLFAGADPPVLMKEGVETHA